MRTGAHAFKAGTDAILASGKCYWMVIIHPNAFDTFLPMVFGMLATASMPGYTVVPSALIDMSDIDQSIDIQKDTIAKAPAFDFTITNLVYTVDITTILNRRVTIRFGYGDTMSIATSDLMFTGVVNKCTPNEKEVKLLCSGVIGLDAEIGTIVDSEVDEGKIAPIIHGDWTTGLTPTIKKLSSSGSFVVSSVAGRSKYGDPTKFFIYKSGKAYQVVSSRLFNYIDVDGGSYVVTESSTIISTITYNSTINSVHYGSSPNGVCINRIEVSSIFYTATTASIDGKSKVLIATKSTYGDGLYSVFDTRIESGKYYIYLNCISRTGISGIPTGSTAYLINEDDSGYFTVKIVAKAIGLVKVGYPDPSSSITVLLRNISQGELGLIQTYKNIQIVGDDRKTAGTYNWSYNLYPCYEDFDIDGMVVSAGLLIKSRYSGGSSSSASDYWQYKTSKAALSGSYSNTINFTGTSDVNYDNESQDPLYYQLDVGVSKSKTLAEFLNDGSYFQIKRNRATATPITDTIVLDSIGLKIWLACKVADSTLWAQSYGLKAPFDYYTVLYTGLIENPMSVMEDYFRSFFPNNSISSVDRDSLESIATARSSWKLATALYTGCKLNG